MFDKAEDKEKLTEPAKFESTPFKVCKDDNGQLNLKVDPCAAPDGIGSFNQIVGVKDSELARHLILTGLIAVKVVDPDQEKLNIVLQALNDIKPKDSIEASLIMQAVSLHSQGMDYLLKADKADRFEHMQYFGNLATKLLRLHNETIEALSRYRRGGEQRVVVQHQEVTISGQAVVGQFHSEGGGGISNI